VSRKKETSVFYYGWAKKSDGELIESWDKGVISEDPVAQLKEKLGWANSIAMSTTRNKCLRALNEVGLNKIMCFRGGSRAFVSTCEEPENVIMKELIKRRINPEGETKLHDGLVVVEVYCHSGVLLVEITLKNTRDNNDLMTQRFSLDTVKNAALNETSPAEEAIHAAEAIATALTTIGESNVAVYRDALQKLDDEYAAKRAEMLAQRETTEDLIVSMMGDMFEPK